MANHVISTLVEIIRQAVAPSAAPSGTLLLYPKTDDKLYTMTSGSVETEVGTKPTTITTSAVSINGAPLTSRDLAFQTSAVNRWIVRVNNDIEGGSNTGSNLQIISRTDAGALLASVVTLTRDTGLVTLSSSLLIGGNFISSAANAAVELGSIAGPGTPFIDFHSSGNLNDYDARLIASGGASSIELGTLTARAAVLAASAALTAGTSITAANGDITASNGDLYARSSTAATGFAKLTKGTTTNGGYLAVFGTDGVRQGYVGFGLGAGGTPDTTELRYVSGQHLFSGPIYENAQRVYSPNNPPPASVSRTMPFFMG